MNFVNDAKFKRVCLIVWALAIWIGSLMPSPPPTVENGDKFQHFFAYAILAFFAFRLKPGLLRVWLFAAGMGVTVELAQSLTSWRSFDVLDMVANGLGALIGLLVCRILIASGVKFL